MSCLKDRTCRERFAWSEVLWACGLIENCIYFYCFCKILASMFSKYWNRVNWNISFCLLSDNIFRLVSTLVRAWDGAKIMNLRFLIKFEELLTFSSFTRPDHVLSIMSKARSSCRWESVASVLIFSFFFPNFLEVWAASLFLSCAILNSRFLINSSRPKFHQLWVFTGAIDAFDDWILVFRKRLSELTVLEQIISHF